MSSMPHRCLRAALLLCGLLVATSREQYLEDSIDVGGGYVGSLAYSSVQGEIRGASWSASSVFAISCDSNKVVRSIALNWPRYLAYDSVDNKGHIAFKGAGKDSLAVIGGSTHQVIDKLEVPGAMMPVWDPVSDRVCVSYYSPNMVAVVDRAEGGRHDTWSE